MLTPTIPLSFALALPLSLSLARSLPLSLSFSISIALACLWQRQAWQTRVGEPGSGSIKGPADVVTPASALPDQCCPVIEILSGYQSGY